MLGYSKIKHEIFIVPKTSPAKPRVSIEATTHICRLNDLNPKQWAQMRKLQGWRAVLYLRLQARE